MASIYLTAVAPNAGNSSIAGGLVALLLQQGNKAAYFKPVALQTAEEATGDGDADASFLREALPSAGRADVIAPIPTTAEALTQGLGPLAQRAREEWSKLSAANDVVVVDGLVGSGATAVASAELAEIIDDKVVGVLRYRRGAGVEEARSLRERFGARLLGVLLNAVPAISLRHAREVTAPALHAAGITVLGIIPEDSLLVGFTVAEYCSRLGGRLMNNQERAGEIVENLLIGAMVLDASEYYYERKVNKALITRGDRPDLQWSALDGSTRCLILTEDAEPIPYVLEKAKEEEVPVVVVPKGTLDTVVDIEAFIKRPTFHHPQKLARVAELLDSHLDLGGWGL